MKLIPPNSVNSVEQTVYPPTWLRQRRAQIMTGTDRPNDLGQGPECEERTASPVRTIRSDELLRGNRELQIAHGDEVYRLLVTRNNKLILQK